MGGTVLDLGFGIRAVPLAAAMLAAVSLIITLFAWCLSRRPLTPALES